MRRLPVLLMVLAVAALALGLVTGSALAGKKKSRL